MIYLFAPYGSTTTAISQSLHLGVSNFQCRGINNMRSMITCALMSNVSKCEHSTAFVSSSCKLAGSRDNSIQAPLTSHFSRISRCRIQHCQASHSRSLQTLLLLLTHEAFVNHFIRVFVCKEKSMDSQATNVSAIDVSKPIAIDPSADYTYHLCTHNQVSEQNELDPSPPRALYSAT